MSTSSSQIKLGPASLTEALFESLRARIINGEIAPGERVTEQRVADEYGVARPTAKSCLERLTSLGLLRRVAHKSAVVPQLAAAEIADLFFSRETFEAAATAHLARNQRLPPEMTQAQTTMTQAADRGDFAEQVQADIAFHWGLVHGLSSERLSRMYEMISGEIHLTMGQYAAHRRTTPSTVVSEHEAIMAAIRDGDEERACTALIEHLAHARDRVLAQVNEGE
ncbi:GntR family transcriptional regulator [Ruania halotolerans]|uniref:GntR family transcriptional regulator n=1 Tax=Ruania halotolerans TaxID=2897773 RepID=UPI001E404388|nr:GntR family transcriptional regulator [Ruania halotolerans]UFU07896.1 GntR family transcriptional regulator [Ruania halotolerans]